MRRAGVGPLAIAALASLNIALWLLFPPENDQRAGFGIQWISEIFSSTGMVFMACALVLSLRSRFFEANLGGPANMDPGHLSGARPVLVLILLHFVTIPIVDPENPGRLLGKIALFGLLALVALTLVPRLPLPFGQLQIAYHQWRWTHKLVGVFFIIGIIHTLNVKNLLQFAELPALYWKVITYSGAAAYVYQIILAPFIRRTQQFHVSHVRHLNRSTVEVSLTPIGDLPPQRAGQFAFVRFPQHRMLREAHPFTISSAPDEPTLRLSIKAAGDWTSQLYQTLTPGTPASVEGCYGAFDYTSGGPFQIWVAGGIGVTPFLSWVRAMKSNPHQQIHFFYTIRAEADALFWEEFAAAAARYGNFHAQLNISSRHGSLTADRIAASAANLAGADVYLCGPAAMTIALRRQLTKRGIPGRRIHYEEFNFR